MPAFLVELPQSGGKTLINAANSLIVFALDATDARAMAANAFDGDSDVLWNSAQTIVTEIIAGTALPTGFELEILIHNDGAGAGIAVPAVYRAEFQSTTTSQSTRRRGLPSLQRRSSPVLWTKAVVSTVSPV